jgi:uncharacterized membrane protein
MGYLYVFLTLFLTVYGQIVLKWRLNALELPSPVFDKILFLLKSIFDPYIFSSFFSAFLASLTWMLALKEFELSKAYPFMSSSFVIVVILSYFFLKETISIEKTVGCILIIAGIIVISRAT